MRRHADVKSRRFCHRSASGLALLAVLWVVTLAGLILLGVIKSSRVNYAMARNELASVQARWLARAGVEQALAVLEDDEPGLDGPGEDWHDCQELFKDVAMEGGMFRVTAPPEPTRDPRQPRYGLIDHAGLLNVNVADAKQLAALLEMTASQVDSILDWRDGDEDPRPSGGERGAYQHLRFGYNIRNAAFRDVQELRLVKDIDPLTYYGEDTNLNGILDPNEDDLTASPPADNGDGNLSLGLAGLATVYSYELNQDAAGSPRLNIRSSDAQTLAKRFGFSSGLAQAVAAARPGKPMDLLNVRPQPQSPQPSPPRDAKEDEGKLNQITLGWLAEHLDELTVSGQERLPGRINVNTAPAEVLMALPGMTAETAKAILTRRTSAQGPFRSVGELLGSQVVSPQQFQALAEQATVRSSVFEIRSTGVTEGGIRHTIIAVVDRSSKPMTILYWCQGE